MEPQAPVFRWWGRHPGSGSAVAAAVGAVVSGVPFSFSLFGSKVE